MSNAGSVRTDKGGRPLVDARTGRPKVTGGAASTTADKDGAK